MGLILSLSRFYHGRLVKYSQSKGDHVETATAQRYRAYLLRLWQVDDDQTVAWRALLEDPRTGERLGFADLPSLFAFLNEVCHTTKRDD